jgi:transcriptional regulator with XRE-family HTH domain
VDNYGFKMDIKEKITSLLSLKNITIKELAEKIEMSETGFHYTLKNNSFKFETILKICEYFNVDITYFTQKPFDITEFGELPEGFDKLFQNELDNKLSLKNSNKLFEIKMAIGNKSGISKIEKMISNISYLSKFINDYYYTNFYFDSSIINSEIDNLLRTRKNKYEIINELLPLAESIAINDKINQKGLKKFEKQMISFYKELIENVTDEQLLKQIKNLNEELES